MDELESGTISLKKITLDDDTYWKLLHLKVQMKCRTWKELIDKLHEISGRSAEAELPTDS